MASSRLSLLLCLSNLINYCALFLFALINAQEDPALNESLPLDGGPPSFGTIVPPTRVKLPPAGQLQPRSRADLEAFEEALRSLPGQPVQVRRKFSNANPESQAISKAARAIEWGRMFGFEAFDVQCPVHNTKCNPLLPIRSADGSCNNLEHPEWGARHSLFTRLIPPAYEDGRSAPRGTVYTDSLGYLSRLPSPRVVSSNIMMGNNVSDTVHTHALMQFGQFVDHDLSSNSKGEYDCCDERIAKQPKCFNIDVNGDVFYAAINRTCMDFSRSDFHCLQNNPWFDQFNDATSFLDCSQVYGSTKSLQMALRQHKDGLLATNQRLKDFLPTRLDLGMEINEPEDPEDFVAGDGRVMSQPTLLSFHVLWLREHNRIASQLKTALTLDNFGDHAKDQVLFQEARKIVNAEMQNIVYAHFLPEILPPEILDKFGLKLAINSTYYSQANPTLRNEFSTAANRYGHSQVQDLFEGKGQPWRLGKFFGDVTFAVGEAGDGFEKELAGVSLQNALKVDRFVTSELMNNLFNSKKLSLEQKFNLKGKGHDLISINIQRGRDHGLPGYNHYRAFFGLRPIASMDEKPDEIDESTWDAIRLVYSHPDDIDLYAGGLGETAMFGGLLGPVFTHIVADQYKLLKDGDRFFFTHGNGPQAMGLHPAIQEMVMKRTLGDIICQNTDSIERLQRNVFRNDNEVVPCDDPTRASLNFDVIASIISRKNGETSTMTTTGQQENYYPSSTSPDVNEIFVQNVSSMTEAPYSSTQY